MRQRYAMCVINRDVVEDLAPVAGTSADVMMRLGISWNSWIKIVAGMPIRRSVALRLKDRALAQHAAVESFRRRFPSTSTPDGVDRAALDRAFMQLASDTMPASMPTFRSVRRASDFARENRTA